MKEAVKQDKLDIEQKQGRITSLEQDLRNEKSQREADAAKFKLNIYQLEDLKQELITKIESDEDRLNLGRETIHQMNTNISELNDRLVLKEQLKTILENQTAGLRIQVKTVQDELLNLGNQLRVSEQKIKDLETTQAILNRTQTQLQTTEDALKQTRVNLTATKQNLEATATDLTSTKATLDQTQQELSNLNHAKKELEAQHQSQLTVAVALSARVAELETTKAELERTKADLLQERKDLQQSVDQEKSRLKQLIQDLEAEKKKHLSEKAILDQQVDKLQKEKAKLEVEVRSLQVDISALKADIEDKINTLEQQDAHLTLLQQLYDAEIKQLQETVDLLNRQLVEEQ